MKTKRSAQKRSKTAAATEFVTVDYPREGEKITALNYSFRVCAPMQQGPVEVSLNKGRWLPCRQDGGYWWFDWASVAPGRYKLRARAAFGDNGKARLRKTLLRRFQVAAS